MNKLKSQKYGDKYLKNMCYKIPECDGDDKEYIAGHEVDNPGDLTDDTQ